MIPRKLLIINGLLIVIAAGSAVFIARQFMVPVAMPLPERSRPTTPATAREVTPAPEPGAYTTVAARNLFSPTRTESPPGAVASSAASPAVKPNLFGIVLRDGAPIAYLEDPSTKRVAGYRVGDAVAGGTVQTIAADSVVIQRSDGNVDVRLRDPSKPRSAPASGPPGVQPVAGAPLPGVIPPSGGPAVGAPGQPPGGVQPPGQILQPGAPPIIPGRRPLPPNLLRRLPQGSSPDATQR